jgi:hypothetical protein
MPRFSQVVLGFLLACSGAVGTAETECSDARPCPEDEFCLDGACRPLGWCRSNNDCPTSRYCRDNVCYAECDWRNCVCAPDGSCLYGLECRRDSDCGEGEWCGRGFCRERHLPAEGTGEALECNDVTDCPTGAHCGRDGRCSFGCDPDVCWCVAGRCVREYDCAANTDCAEGEQCFGRFCTPVEEVPSYGREE